MKEIYENYSMISSALVFLSSHQMNCKVLKFIQCDKRELI